MATHFLLDAFLMFILDVAASFASFKDGSERLGAKVFKVGFNQDLFCAGLMHT